MIPHTGCHSLEKNTCLAPEVWLPVPWGLCTFPAPTSPSQTKFLQVQFTEAYLGYNSSLSDTGGFPGGSDGEASPYNEGDPGWIPGSGRSPWRRNGNPLQSSCLENPMDTGICWAIVRGVTKSWTWLTTTSTFNRDSKRIASPVEWLQKEMSQPPAASGPTIASEDCGGHWSSVSVGFFRLRFHGFISIRELNFSSYVRWILARWAEVPLVC